jgi:hypothetical protein
MHHLLSRFVTFVNVEADAMESDRVPARRIASPKSAWPALQKTDATN